MHNQYPDPREWTDRDQADGYLMVLLRKAERSSRGGLHSDSQERLLEGTEVPRCPSPFSSIQEVCGEEDSTVLFYGKQEPQVQPKIAIPHSG